MVAELVKRCLVLLVALVGVVLVGCGEPEGANLEQVESQPPADLEAGRNAQTIEQWAQANPNNGAPGHGENTEK